MTRKGIAFVLIATALVARADARPGRVVGTLPDAPAGFDVAVIARIAGARELSTAPGGDLFVGTSGSDVYLVHAAETKPEAPRVYASFDDDEAAGVALADGWLFVGTEHAVWRLPYRAGQQRATSRPRRIAAVRTEGGDDHVTTSLAVAGHTLYASIGSSCNVCDESDPTRASVQRMTFEGRDMRAAAIHIRNAIALANNPGTAEVWGGVAGQDELTPGHPYEIFDPLTRHAGTPDYGWPACYENRKPARPGTDCSKMTVARVVMPAYATPTGAVFYPSRPSGRYAFPQAYRGGAFVSWHGSWHSPPVPPRVVFVPMRAGEPLRIDWNDPTKQWTPFLGGFQIAGYGRVGRPTGIAVGTEGSLFVADDFAGVVYRIRPRISGTRPRP